MNSNSWKTTKAIGDDGESIAETAIRRHWNDLASVRRVPSNLEAQRSGDLVVTHTNGQRWFCEVKRDTIATRTGQLAIETARRMGFADVRTGLSQSQSHAWAFVLDDRVILALARELRGLIARLRADCMLTEKRGGDGLRTLLAIVRIDDVTALPSTIVIHREAAR